MQKIKAIFIGLLIGVFVLVIGDFYLDKQGESEAMAAPSTFENLDLPPEGTFNAQIQALEVTQGMRTEIPSRTDLGDSLTLSPDGATHIANRRTFVRAYPLISGGANVKVPPLSAKLWAYRDGVLLAGSPISPVNALLENISPEYVLEELRSDASLSWNFLLPSEWTAADADQGSFSLRFLVAVNPAGPDQIAECQDCMADNHVILDEQTFVFVPPIKIKPYLVDHTFTDQDGSEVNFPAPSMLDFRMALNTVYRLFPIGDAQNGIILLAPEHITWHGALKKNGKHVFAETMIDQYLPGGSLDADHDGVYYLFLFNASKKHWDQVNELFEGAKTGLAWVGKPYLQAGARGSELAHELAHAIGLDHAGNLHGEASHDLDYPDDCGRVEPNAYGFDIMTMQAIPPGFEPYRTHDFMSYDRSNPEWVSLYTWSKLAQLLGQPEL